MYAASSIKRLLSDRKHLCEGESAALERTALVDLVEDKLHVGEKHLVGWWVEKSVTWKLMSVIECSLHGKRRCLT
jgi:hypothetical protein